MKFIRKFFLAACVSGALAGCGSDDSSDEGAKRLDAMRFDGASFVLTEGESQTPALLLRPAGGTEYRFDVQDNRYEVRFAMADPAIAAVTDRGVVTALKAGTTTLTARSPYCAAVATAQIVVRSAVTPIEIASLRFEQTQYEVEAGQSVEPQLLVRISGETAEFAYDAAKNPYAMSWMVSDPAVAAVSDRGVVTALTEGTITLTARTSFYNGAATTTVKCTPPPASCVGEWVLESWKGDKAMAGKVYLELTDAKTFTIYQNINTVGFAKFAGTYAVTVQEGQPVLTGTYADGKSWGESYTFAATDRTLTLTGRTFGYVSVYDSTTIPDYVKDGVTTQATRSTTVPFL